jgi:hypothetical protein
MIIGAIILDCAAETGFLRTVIARSILSGAQRSRRMREAISSAPKRLLRFARNDGPSHYTTSALRANSARYFSNNANVIDPG